MCAQNCNPTAEDFARFQGRSGVSGPAFSCQQKSRPQRLKPNRITVGNSIAIFMGMMTNDPRNAVVF